MANTLQQPEVAPDNGIPSEEKRRFLDQQRKTREREMQSLQLQRENILSQRTSSPVRRSALEAALAQIEAQIEALG